MALFPERGSGGGDVIKHQDFTAVVPNITPDRETGIGSWTDEELVTAIREGRRPDGSLIGPAMPSRFYRGLGDDDARRSLFACELPRPFTIRSRRSRITIRRCPHPGARL